MNALQATEELSRAAAKTANRVSLDDIKANISAEYFITGDKAVAGAPVSPDLRVLTICILVMRNGFTIIGKAAPADPENFNPELGRTFAREDAIRQAWPLMGYALREKLSAAA
jgi:hypothetical protein